MREKGTITAQQEAELLKALEADDDDETSAEARPAEETLPGGETNPLGVEDPSATYGRKGRARSRSFLDMGWVEDMVDGITSGLGVTDTDRRWDEPGASWEPRRASRRGGNTQNGSRVDQPEGQDYEFQGNRVVFSKLLDLHLVRSRVKDNSFSASTIQGADLTDSSMKDNSFAGSALRELHMEEAAMKDVIVAGSKLTRFDLRTHSVMKNARISGSTLTAVLLQEESAIEDTRVSGATLNGFTLSAKARLKDSRLSGVPVSRLPLQGGGIFDTRLDGCVITEARFTDTEVSSCAFHGSRLSDAEIGASRIKDCRFDAIGFSLLRIQNSELKNVSFRDAFVGRLPRKAENLLFQDVKLDNVQFIGCTFRDTTFKGIKVQGMRFRGIDFSGRTIERVEDLAGYSEK
jgi:uncharacterized protein YjbI with pentapeptide repeats